MQRIICKSCKYTHALLHNFIVHIKLWPYFILQNNLAKSFVVANYFGSSHNRIQCIFKDSTTIVVTIGFSSNSAFPKFRITDIVGIKY